MAQQGREWIMGEVERQIQTCVDLDYDKLIGLSEREYRESFRGPLLPLEVWDGKFDRLLVVENRLRWWHKLMMINRGHLSMPKDAAATDLFIEAVVPTNAHFLWFQAGKRYAGTHPSDIATDIFSSFERGLSVTEGLDVFVNHPDILSRWDVPCSLVQAASFDHRLRNYPILWKNPDGQAKFYLKDRGRPHIWIPSCGVWSEVDLSVDGKPGAIEVGRSSNVA